ncbi:hypothetical protein E4K67_02625 [Desulfosporosinus fructosivorans]|uniref:DUF2680 domain-containing protein n=1 Tax=Desulfosporosinus fructosivorans TaxID=2018669 RepID=A0A4Z0RAM0_9FIRM|nr:hypothetical protein [Desulfosporosinus fructosivorans]TGE39898.1 hypothetical protein E4K67_02625 [Desulfosporosinus fructosivorans]
MKNFKKLIAVATIIGSLGVVGVAGASYATGTTTPAGIAAGLTGKSVEDVTAQRAAGTTYGAIAQEAGKLDEFKAQSLEQKKLVLDQRVADGNLTQAQADDIYNSIKTNQATCDGTGSAGIGKANGVGFGQGIGTGRGSGQRNGGGMGRGMGNGLNNQ